MMSCYTINHIRRLVVQIYTGKPIWVHTKPGVIYRNMLEQGINMSFDKGKITIILNPDHLLPIKILILQHYVWNFTWAHGFPDDTPVQASCQRLGLDISSQEGKITILIDPQIL